jgi:hypothetical protein
MLLGLTDKLKLGDKLFYLGDMFEKDYGGAAA